MPARDQRILLTNYATVCSSIPGARNRLPPLARATPLRDLTRKHITTMRRRAPSVAGKLSCDHIAHDRKCDCCRRRHANECAENRVVHPFLRRKKEERHSFCCAEGSGCKPPLAVMNINLFPSLVLPVLVKIEAEPEKKRPQMSAEMRLKLWTGIGSKIVARFDTEYDACRRFHVSAWRLYKRVLKRKIIALENTRLSHLKVTPSFPSRSR